MRVATPDQMREADRLTIAGGFEGRRLMERAGEGAAAFIHEWMDDLGQEVAHVFCGKGNNGGDGFVVARHLARHGLEVRTFVTADLSEVAGDARSALDDLLATGAEVTTLRTREDVATLEEVIDRADVVVDALLGTGFEGTLRDPIAALVTFLDGAPVDRIALDVPSGVNGRTGAVEGPAIHADATVTFGLPKVGLLLHPGRSHAGEIHVVDIGIRQGTLDEAGVRQRVATGDELHALLPRRTPDAHKGDAGRVWIVGGSPGMTGAVTLAASAALRSGAGLVTAVVPGRIHDVMEVKLTEAITIALGDAGTATLGEDHVEAILDRLRDDRVDALAVGPGLSSSEEAFAAARALVRAAPIPTVVDADGLNAFAGRAAELRECAGPRILTPHPGEAARLLDGTVADVRGDVVAAARALQRRTGTTVVLKGAPSVVVGPSDELVIGSTGNPGMATGGTGDVLTGVIAALLGQGMEPDDAAVLGVHVHGLAGDVVAAWSTVWGLVAGDLVTALPEAFHALDTEAEGPEWLS